MFGRDIAAGLSTQPRPECDNEYVPVPTSGLSLTRAVLNYVPPRQHEYHKFISKQEFAYLDVFELESGEVLEGTIVAYKTWGKLNANGDNCLVICHALSGSSDIADWWGPLLGNGSAFDTSRYFIFCANVLGSPYGTTSSLSINPRTGCIYGPEIPQTTIRDDVR